MFKMPSAADYWRSQKASSTAQLLDQLLVQPRDVVLLLRYLAAAHWLRFLHGGLVALSAADMVSKCARAGAKEMGLATSTTNFECKIGDGLARIILNRPDRGNPIDGDFCREFSLGMAEISERDDVRAVLISARGKLFSVGGDLVALGGQGEGLPITIKTWTADLHAAIVRMVRMRAPVVAAVQGNVAGGSVSLMAAADLVVIGKSVRISSAFAKIGFSPDSGSTTTLTARMGPARAKRFFLMAETLDADAAMSTGLVDFVVDDDTVVAEAERIARELASGPTEAYAGIKRLFLQARNQSLESQMEDEAQTLAAISRTVDAREGIKAFQEKRSPVFVGR
jgi:2-(1,2-epoxy-1,2-dihydrophenyl)acetyl-CoA isomerase